MPSTGNSRYKWYMLFLTALTYGAIIGAERMCLPVLFKEISLDLNLNLVSIGTIWGLDPLAGMVIGLPAGLLTDRFGLKRTVGVLAILSGILGALRGFSTSFLTMSITMFAFGLVVAALPSGIPKVTAIWFSGPRLGIANAFLNVAGSLGAMVGLMLSATVLSPWLGGWERVLFLFGAPAVVIGLLWLFTGRESPQGGVTPQPYTGVPFKQAVLTVIRFKEVWIIGLIAAMYWASNMGLNGYLPLYLRDIGWTPVESDGLVTAITGVTMVGGIPMVLLSDRWHSRRKIIVLSLVLMTLNLVLLPWLDGTPLWVLLLICGLFRSAASTLFSVAILELKGVGSTYSGTASGLMSAIGMAGAFIGPPLGNALADMNPGYPFYFWAFLNTLGLIGCIFFKENHWKENTAV